MNSSKNKISFGLFFCHLAIEKALKALFIKKNKDFPLKTHNLLLLAHKSNIELNSDRKIFLSKMMGYQLEGRYPELMQSVPPLNDALNLLESTKEILKWLQKS